VQQLGIYLLSKQSYLRRDAGWLLDSIL